jgi:hypothetical protein
LNPLPLNPRSRIRPVHTESTEQPARRESVIYQLEDTGNADIRLRPTVRELTFTDRQGYLYRVEAFSRLTGERLGAAESIVEEGSAADHAARSRDFMSAAFREVVAGLEAGLVDRFHNVNPEGAIQK